MYLVTRRGTMPSNMLSFDDRKFLLAVERGDVASTRRYVKKLIWKRIFLDFKNCKEPKVTDAAIWN